MSENLNGLKIFAESGLHLGNGFKLILNILSPEAIFLGGSISQLYKYFEYSLYDTLDTFPFQSVRDQLVVQHFQTSNSVILGAAALVISAPIFREAVN